MRKCYIYTVKTIALDLASDQGHVNDLYFIKVLTAIACL